MAAAEEASLTFEEGTLNPKAIVCSRCSSVIIAVGQATFVSLQVEHVVLGGYSLCLQKELPCAMQKGQALSGADVARDVISKCWLLRDMFHFENVGFCREVESTIKVRKIDKKTPCF